jgi:hypothetical protein
MKKIATGKLKFQPAALELLMTHVEMPQPDINRAPVASTTHVIVKPQPQRFRKR